MRWRSSQQPSLPGPSGLAAPRFSPVEQRRDKASLAQIALRTKFRRAAALAGGDGAILPLQAPAEGASSAREGADWQKAAKQGREPRMPSRRAAGLGGPATASRRSTASRCSTVSRCSTAPAPSPSAQRASTSVGPVEESHRLQRRGGGLRQADAVWNRKDLKYI